MPTYHSALSALLQTTGEELDKAVQALTATAEALKTAQHLVEQKNWWHEERIGRPVMYCYGPIEGSKKALARWIFPDLKDPRCIENANRKPGILWAVKLPANPPQHRFQVWFTSKSMFQDAQARKISELKTRK